MPDGVGTTHHVKINGQFYLIRPGTYRKRPAPLFGSRFTTGDPDYNNLSFWQHWVQQCWIGGFGAETWMDDAMFHQGVGIDGSQHEVLVLSRDLGPTSNRDASGNWDLTAADGDQLREFTIFNDTLYVLSKGGSGAVKARLFKWTGATWSNVKNFTEQVESMEPFHGYLVFGDAGANMNRMDTSEVFTTFAKPGGVTAIPYMLKTYRSRLYAGFGRDLYRLKTDFTWDGSTAFYEAVGITRFHKADVHLNMLYMSSNNGHILRTDGNSTFDLWQFDPGIRISSVRSFDGRLFVACMDPLDGTTAQEGVLYQFTGAAVTELKRWGLVGRDITLGKLRVIGNSMFFGAGSMLGMSDGVGFGIARYDPVEDAYHMWSVHQGSGTFAAGTEGISHSVDDVIFHKGWVYCSVRGHGIFRTKLSFQDVTRFQATYDTTKAGGSPGSKNGGWYESSDFDAGTPGLLKLWNAMTVHVDLPTAATSIWVDYSIDGGITWAALGSQVGDGVTTRYARTFFFGTGTPKVGVRATRLKYRITLRTTDSTRSPQLRGVIVRYLPIPEPSWQWDFQVVLSEEQELLDGSSQILDATAIGNKLSALETPFRSGLPVNFIDQDLTEWAPGGDVGVIVAAVVEDMPLPLATSEGVRERIVSVQLIESTESYA